MSLFSYIVNENFLRSSAENPPLDLARSSAERVFFSIENEHFSALGRGESSLGSSALGRGTGLLLHNRERKFSALLNTPTRYNDLCDYLSFLSIHPWIIRARSTGGSSTLAPKVELLRSVTNSRMFTSGSSELGKTLEILDYGKGIRPVRRPRSF